ncbi:MAG: hypothetical protein AB7O66_16340 [Limisphaerales bacterium]
MSKKKSAPREYPARRKFALRSDASVGSGQAEFERVFGLPAGSVRLVRPSGRAARVDKGIGALLDEWEK